MIYQLVWATNDEVAFEKAVPLLWHGNHMAKNGWENKIKIGFLEGIELLSKDYLLKLKRLGYEIIDCQPLAAGLIKENHELNRYDTVNKNWFLRWNILDLLTGDNADRDTVVHCDADVVFMSDPNELYDDVKGKTFVLEGCPVLTAISDKDWFRVWREELALFLKTSEEYQKYALIIKDKPIRHPKDYCNVLCYESGRFHDQDMLEFLICAGKLPQSRTEEVFNSPFYWIQNPLFPGEWHNEQCPGSEKKIVEHSANSYVGDKRVAFYHFQTDFSRYCEQWLQLDKVGLGNLASLSRLHSGKRSVSLHGQIMSNTLKLLNKNKKHSKRDIYEAVFQVNHRTGNLYITDIANSCWK